VTPQPQRSDQCAFALGHTDAWHGDRLKEVRGRDHGGRIRGEAGRLQAPWANGLSEDLAIKDIDTTRRVVAELRKKLELNGERAST
jgi:hypothetical protein